MAAAAMAVMIFCFRRRHIVSSDQLPVARKDNFSAVFMAYRKFSVGHDAYTIDTV